MQVEMKTGLEIESRVKAKLSLVGLESLERRRPSELSGGQKQRVALARALAIDPRLLLLDEPLSNVDEATKTEVKTNLKEMVKKTGVTTICVLHDSEDALELRSSCSDVFRDCHSGRFSEEFD